jgi:serine/threonine protein phosphatase PrpC
MSNWIGQHRYRENQDAWFSVERVQCGDFLYSGLGVLDGHGVHGGDVASFCCEVLQTSLKEHILEEGFEKGLETVVNCLHGVALDKFGGKLTGSGTTLSCAFLEHNERALYLVNLGDSRTLVSVNREGSFFENVTNRTKDHGGDNEEEVKNLPAEGVIFEGYVTHRKYASLNDMRYRTLLNRMMSGAEVLTEKQCFERSIRTIDEGVQVTRGIGDCSLDGVLKRYCEIQKVILQPGDRVDVLVASDGFFDHYDLVEKSYYKKDKEVLQQFYQAPFQSDALVNIVRETVLWNQPWDNTTVVCASFQV